MTATRPRMKVRANTVGEYVSIARRSVGKFPALAGWTVGVNAAKDALGVCAYDERRIYLSEYWLSQLPRLDVIDTILHEVAHALAGHEAGHGRKWQETAAQVGAQPRATAMVVDVNKAGFGVALLVNDRSGEILRVWNSFDRLPQNWRSGSATDLYPPSSRQDRGRVRFYLTEDVPAGLLKRLRSPADFIDKPFLRRFVARSGKRRLYLNGVGIRYPKCYLEEGANAGLVFVISQGVPSEDDRLLLEHALSSALADLGCDGHSSFDTVFSSCRLGTA